MSRAARGALTTVHPRRGQAGQALPLFVLMIFVLTGSVAVVTDVSWFWVNQQRMQRAADAGALAGAVYLPGDPADAYLAALAATKRNGYTNGSGGVTVTPVQEVLNRRRLDVTVAGPIGTYFARVFGLSQVAGSAQGKAEFTLPVPMGSPENYYGVGDFTHNVITTTTNQTHNTVDGDTGNLSEGTYSGSGWTDPTYAASNDNSYATTSTTNAAQQWINFGLQAGSNGIPNDSTLVIDGIVVELNDMFLDSSSSSCRVSVDLNWNNGKDSNWSGVQTTSPLTTTTTADYTVGSTSDNTSGWGSHTWAYSDFANSTFRVRLTWTSCGRTRTISLDQLQVRVYYQTVTTTTTTTTTAAPTTDHTINAPTSGTLASHGFWGAVITKGGNRGNGDEFSPYNDNVSGHPIVNPEYDPTGYDYAVILPGGNGQVRIYDASFCETGYNGSGGDMGAGDHWIDGSANGVTTVYTLWNEMATPYNTADDVQVATSGNTFATQIQADYSAVMGYDKNQAGNVMHSGLQDCSNPAVDPYHDAWYTLASNLPAGRYRMNVNTSSANNNGTNAENMWSAWVNSSGSGPQVYGEARMASYNNLIAGSQTFYLAQIDASNAGKTMEISLFDPGDLGVGGNAVLKLLSPDGNAYTYANFSYTADNGLRSPGTTLVQSIQVATNGASNFNDSVITIEVPLPNTYGQGGLTPGTETQPGWWRVEYTVNGGNDTITWQVSIKGSPVHLVR